MGFELRLASGLHLTDPNASDLRNFLIGAFDVLIILIIIFVFFYLRNPNVRKRRQIRIEERDERYKERDKRYKVRKAAERLARNKNKEEMEAQFNALPQNHLRKKLARVFSFTGNLVLNITIVVGFILIVIFVVVVASHNGSCIGPDMDYSTCYP